MGCNCGEGNHTKKQWAFLPATLSLALLVGGVVLKHFGLLQHPVMVLAWYIVAYLPVGLPVLREALQGILRKDFFSEFTLMSIATIGAFCIGEYPEGVAVMLFYSIGELFQERAVGRAHSSIRALLDVRPESATVLRNGKAVPTHPKQVAVGEVIEVRAGERVPLDGQLLSQQAAFNTAALTGESTPRTLRLGDEVLAGMIATDRAIRLTVEKPYDQSALSRILALVQEAAARKAPVELFIRKFAHIYTPIVTGLAVLIVLLPWLYGLTAPWLHEFLLPPLGGQLTPGFTFVFSDWLYRALVFLVISCPCALVISIPLGYFGGIGAASRAGILFKGSNYLDAITRVDTVVFDKTGTLTQGVFEVQRIHSLLPGGEDELLAYIATAEQQSTHPIARAILQQATTQGISLIPPLTTEEIAGHGLRVSLNKRAGGNGGCEVLVGSPRLLAHEAIPYPAEELEAISETIVACAIDGRYAGYLLLSDTPKPDAFAAIASLKALNITNIQILSGDKQEIVSNLAAHLGIAHAYGDLLPEGKVAHLEELKRDPARCIAFVGDGINDAPVLALSDVGVAMGALGSDAAIETADVVIQTDQPSRLATAIRIGRATRRIVWQNIGLAFSVKLIVMLFGAAGVATLWEAVFADVGVALLAILNAVRIQKQKF